MKLNSFIDIIKQGRGLDEQQMKVIILAMMEGKIAEDDTASFLLALKEKGETVSEIVGAAEAMRSKMETIDSDRTRLVDTCGTGGDGSGTFNVSTAAAIVAAGAGISIAKHGNRKVSSQTGSADVLTELGVNVSASKHLVEKCLDEVGLCFCFAPLFHGSVKNVAAARKKLGVPTIFNMLGPMCNPARAEHQLVGVGKPWQREKLAAALQALGTKRSLVVHGDDGICEISNVESTSVSIVSETELDETVWSSSDFGIQKSNREGTLAADPIESANLIRSVLDNHPSSALDIVLLNAASAIWLAKDNLTLAEAAMIAKDSIASGNAKEKLAHLAAVSQST